MSEDQDKAVGGCRMMVSGMRGLLHGYERLQRGAQMIAEEHPEAVGGAMEIAKQLGPVFSELKTTIEGAERFLEAEGRKP